MNAMVCAAAGLPLYVDPLILRQFPGPCGSPDGDRLFGRSAAARVRRISPLSRRSPLTGGLHLTPGPDLNVWGTEPQIDTEDKGRATGEISS
ncbi:hypothetical protein GCM10010246_59930 [Streptomyces cuspidosporus]|uniref:Uncharacterized protein n=1 Tax=Streptomyces cuspidosporus TaxID=66882 RepID=A0ABP5TTJ5_9ACTN